MQQPEPTRHIDVASDLFVYVSDTGHVVLAERDGSAIGIDVSNVPAVVASLQALLPIAAAKESAVLAVSEAEYQAAVAMGKAL